MNAHLPLAFVLTSFIALVGVLTLFLTVWALDRTAEGPAEPPTSG